MNLLHRSTPISIRSIMLGLLSAAVAVFLFMPIVVVIVYSFNAGDFLIFWRGAGTRWYESAARDPNILAAVKTSLIVSFCSAPLSVVWGGLTGYILARRSAFVAAPLTILLLVILSFPEIVKGVAYLMWFVRIGLDVGYVRMVLGHAVFGSAIVAFIVRARLMAMDPRLGEAAADLGATPFVVSRTVTWPLAFPAFVAGGLLAFTFSFDDVIISMFVSTASTTPLPVYILGSIRQGLRGDVAAVSSFMFLLTVIVFIATSVVLARSTRTKRGVVLLLAGRTEGIEESGSAT